MTTDLMNELTQFQQKKEDVMKNINLLNSFSEKLTLSIQEEEKKIGDVKNKEILVSKQKAADHELELLGIENKKMETYMEVLAKKQELELRYLEQICEQRSRVEKLNDKYPHIDIKNFCTYDEYYYGELIQSKMKSKKRRQKERREQQQRAEEQQNQQAYQQYLQQQQYFQQQQLYHQQQQQQQQQHHQKHHQHIHPHEEQTESEDQHMNQSHSSNPQESDNASRHSAVHHKPAPPPPKHYTEEPNQSPSIDLNSNPVMDIPATSVAPFFPLSDQLKNPDNYLKLKKTNYPHHERRRTRRRGSVQELLEDALDTKFPAAVHRPSSDESSDESGFDC